jgi:hypothetical protein
MSYNEKILFLTGFKMGVFTALHPSYAGTLPSCQTIVDLGNWDNDATTSDQLRREMDKFYSSAANLPLPTFVVVVYSGMKINRASKQELDQYRTPALKAFVN